MPDLHLVQILSFDSFPVKVAAAFLLPPFQIIQAAEASN